MNGKIEKYMNLFTKLYDQYIKHHSGLPKFVLDLILFVIIGTIGIATLSLIYAFLVWIFGKFFENSQMIVNLIFAVLTLIYTISKIIELLKNKDKEVIIDEQ
tara:strand:- start:35 stop:340 length:306 start_codon:yes stop_codon:yes gene_type:complete